MPAQSESLRVLVVDDEPIIADTMAVILKANNHEVRAAYSAEEAVLIAEVFWPHAVISDVVMGIMNGIDLAVYLAQEQPDCKVLLISGKGEVIGQMEEANQQGSSRVILNKPVAPDTILEFLATCVPKA